MKTFRVPEAVYSLVCTASMLVATAFYGCDRPREETPTSGRLHILASESQASVMRRQVDEFSSVYSSTNITLGITSTRDAVVQLLNDSVRFICIDRPLNDEEMAVAEKAGLEIKDLHVAEDALAFIVNRENPVSDISQAALRGIITGTLKDWKEVEGSSTAGIIEVACTGRNSGTYELLTRNFFPVRTDLPLSFLADSQRATVEFVARRKKGFGIVSVAAVRDTSDPIRILNVEAVDSATGGLSYVRMHQANIYQGKYPYHYPVHAYYIAKRMGLPTGFATFMASYPGQKIFLNAGLAPKQQPVRLVQLREE